MFTIKNKKLLYNLSPLIIVIPYCIYVLQNRFDSNLKRREEIIAENIEKRKANREHVNSKYN